MTLPAEQIVVLDKVHVVHRTGERWALRKRTPEGTVLLDAWHGPLKSLEHRLETHGIVPSRDAETALARLPEHTGFRDRSA